MAARAVLVRFRAARTTDLPQRNRRARLAVNRPLRTALCAATLVTGVGLAALVPVTAAPSATPPRVPVTTQAQRDALAPTDRFIVRFRADALERGNPVARQHLLDNVGRKLGLKVRHGRDLANGAALIRTDHKLDVHGAKRLLLELARDPRIEYVEAERRFRPQAEPLAPQQWHLTAPPRGIGALAAQLRTAGGSFVAVLDTGTTEHPDNGWNNYGYDFISDIASAGDGDGRDYGAMDTGDFVAAGECGPGTPAANSSWHGTQVAGLINAPSWNQVGGLGVAPSSNILPGRVLGKCGGATSDIADAIVWSVGGDVPGVPGSNTVQIVNLSFASAGPCGATLQNAIDYARSTGAVVVAAAGNGHQPAADFAPGNCAGVITVGASNADGLDADSNYGSALDLLAPGAYGNEGLLTNTNLGTTAPGAAGYGTARGTSMSAAQVSGVVSLMRGIRSDYTLDTYEHLLEFSARTPGVPCADWCGHGIVDAEAAVLAMATPILQIQDPVAIIEGDAGTTSVTLAVDLSEPLTNAVTFSLATSNGTAVAGSDFVAPAATTYTIPAGTTRKNVTIAIVGDTTGEDDERFSVNLTNVLGAVPIHPSADVVIANDDLTELERGQARLVPASTGSKLYFAAVPAGARNFSVSMAGGSGDADLYVRAGTPPTRDSYDCAANAVGNAGSCLLPTPPAGLVYVLVDTLTSYTNPTLVANWGTPGRLSIDDVTVNEGNGDQVVEFTVRNANPQPGGGQIGFTVHATNGAATAGSDFDWPQDRVVQMAANAADARFAFTVHGDVAQEANEAFVLSLTGITGATVDDGTAVVTLVNDDVNWLTIDDVTVTEGNAAKVVSVTVWMQQPVPVPVSFTVSTADGSAKAGSDYVARSQAFTIPAYENFRTFDITLPADFSTEGEESFYARLGNVTGVSVGKAQATITVIDDEMPALSVADLDIPEGNDRSTAIFWVRLNKVSPVPVTYTVRAYPNGDGADSAGDFQWTIVTDTIPAGMLAKPFPVRIDGDTEREWNEGFGVTILEAKNATLPAQETSGMILDDDRPRLSISDAQVVEGNAGARNMVFTVSLSDVETRDVSFHATTFNANATGGSDYTPVDLNLQTIPMGQLSRTVTVPILGDTSVEASEVFYVRLTSSSGAPAFDRQGSGLIINDDGPTLSIGDLSTTEGNSGTKTVTYTVQLSQPAAVPVTYTIATANGPGATGAQAGTDYVAKSLVGETIPAGQLSKTFSVTLNGDTTVEPNELVYVNLSNATGASILDAQANVFVVNDDGPTLSIGDASISEGNSGTKTLTFTISLSQASASPVFYNLATGNGSATAGSDYVAAAATGQMIPAGMLSKTFAVTINGDSTTEGNEQFVVTLTGSSGATIADAGAVGTITNDD
jgi:serine protease